MELGERVQSWGRKFQVYLVIEGGIYMPALYALCYRFQPTVMLMQSPTAVATLRRMGAVIQRYTPGYHETILRNASKLYEAPAGRAFAEWTLLMKVNAPIAFPIKMWIAHQIVERGFLQGGSAAATSETER